MKKNIGIVVEDYFDVPHETEQINAAILKKEIIDLGRNAKIFYFYGKSSDEEVFKFSEFFKSKIDDVYLSGKISGKNFVRLLFFCFLKRSKLHFRIPSYNLKMFKRYKVLFSLLIKIGLLKLYSYDGVHKKFIEDELGFEAKVLEPLVNLAPLNKKTGSKKEFDILFIGSYNDLKRGLLELIDAVKIIKKKYKKISLKIISRYGVYTGQKDWFAGYRGKRLDILKTIKEAIKNNGLEKNIIFSGKVDDVGREYDLARVYVLPVREYDKMPAIPFTILESLYHGTPVVSTNYFGVGLVVEKKFLVNQNLDDKKFVESLAKKITLALDKPSKVSLDKKFYSREATKKFLKYVEEK